MDSEEDEARSTSSGEEEDFDELTESSETEESCDEGDQDSDICNGEETTSMEIDSESAPFQVLGTGQHRPTLKPVVSSLPSWLAHPITVEYDLQRHQVALDAVFVSPRMRRTLRKNNITSLFPGELYSEHATTFTFCSTT